MDLSLAHDYAVIVLFFSSNNSLLVYNLCVFSAMLFSVLFSALVLSSSLLSSVDGNEIGVCIRNCAQCKKMLGLYFEGQLCAEACVKFKGKMIPDCENIDSISPFLNKLE